LVDGSDGREDHGALCLGCWRVRIKRIRFLCGNVMRKNKQSHKTIRRRARRLGFENK